MSRTLPPAVLQTQRVGMNHFDYAVAEEILTKGTGEQWQQWNLNALFSHRSTLQLPHHLGGLGLTPRQDLAVWPSCYGRTSAVHTRHKSTGVLGFEQQSCALRCLGNTREAILKTARVAFCRILHTRCKRVCLAGKGLQAQGVQGMHHRLHLGQGRVVYFDDDFVDLNVAASKRFDDAELGTFDVHLHQVDVRVSEFFDQRSKSADIVGSIVAPTHCHVVEMPKGACIEDVLNALHGCRVGFEGVQLTSIVLDR